MTQRTCPEEALLVGKTVSTGGEQINLYELNNFELLQRQLQWVFLIPLSGNEHAFYCRNTGLIM